MKKSLLLVITTFLIQANISAQVVRLISMWANYIYANSIDSAHYTYSGTRGGLDTEESPGFFDNKHRYTHDNGSWVDNERVTVTYNANDQELSELTERFRYGAWRNYDRDFTTYDGAGRLIEHLQQGWDSATAQWKDGYQTIYTYDNNGNELTQTEKNHNGGNGFDWDDRDSSIYDANNREVKDFYITWNGSVWEMVFYRVYTYDANGNLTKVFWQKWNGSSWQDYQVDSNTYDAHNNLLSETNIRRPNGAGNWETSNQWLYKYDSLDNRIEQISNVADGAKTGWTPYNRINLTYNANHQVLVRTVAYYSSGSWTNSTKQERTYNGMYQLTQTLNSIWSSGAWQPSYRSDLTLNNDGLVTNENEYSYQSGNWVENAISRFWYDEVSAVNEIRTSIQTSIFPNPSRGEFTVNFNSEQAGNATLLLFDGTGRLQTRTETTAIAGVNRINYSGIALAAGVYFYQLIIPGAEGRGRVVVE